MSVVIVHAPWDAQRRAWVQQQRRLLAPLPMAVEEDRRREGLWPTQRRAWLRGAQMRTPYVLALADDMLPVPNFALLIEHALDAIDSGPGPSPVCVFSMRGALPEAARQGLAWTTSPEGCWGGATILPRAMAVDFVHWSDQHVRPGYPHDDRRLVFYLYTLHQRVWQTVPSLVEHVGAASSVMGGSNKRRVASLLSDGSPVDWSAGIDAPLVQRGSFDPKAEWPKARLDPDAAPPWLASTRVPAGSRGRD